VYYHFPGGKEQIASEAVLFSSRLLADSIRKNLAESDNVASTLKTFIERIARHVEDSGFKAGGPLMIVAAETATQSESLNQCCRGGYEIMQAAFSEKLRASGLGKNESASLAMSILAAVEGGIVLSRTFHSGEPLRRVALDLSRLVEAILNEKKKT
jgi:TetR/AcrR family transcriptional regulator, lmrAB and yxaGH operons repressor